MPGPLLYRRFFLAAYVSICLPWTIYVCGQSPATYFRHLTVEDGLSNNWVRAIIKDSEGFMWFGTFNGLNRYDGSNFRTFQTSETCHLSDNVIECLAGDSLGNLWIGTFSGGLNRFDRRTEQFTSYLHHDDDPKGISGNHVYALLMDDDTLWIGTDAGLDVLDLSTQIFSHYTYSASDPASITPGLVQHLSRDHHGRLWVGTEGGLCVFDKKNGSFKRFRHFNDQTSLVHDYVRSVHEDKYGNLWIGTWGGGLDKLDVEAGIFQHFRQGGSQPDGLSNNSVLCVTGDHENLIYVGTEGGGLNVMDIQQQAIHAYVPDIANDRSINSNSIHALYYDHDNGILWAGTYNGGINYFSKWDKPFALFQAKVGALNNNHVTGIVQDKSGQLWIGTDGGGVNRCDPDGSEYQYLMSSQGSALQSDAVLALLCDREDRIWVGSYNGGLDVFSNDGRSLAHYRHDPAVPGSLSGSNVSAVYEDKRGNIWVGTMFGGLNLYDATTGTFRHYTHDAANAGSIIDNFIYGVYEDRLGRLLVQTGGGLDVYDYKSGAFERFSPDLTSDIGVPVVLLEDSQGNLWIGSQENGLFRIDRTGVKVRGYTVQDGLPGNSISGLLEDDFGNLWISTQRGLCKFESGVINPDRVRFHMYSTEDGLQGSEFKRAAACKLQDGRMVFGGQNGYNIFDPAQIKYNPFVPPVRITGLRIFNKEVDFASSDVLQAPVSEVAEIRLTHDLSVFTFEFASLNFMLPEKNQYAYMMEGFEDAWNYVGTQRSATYSNLDAGEYWLRVKASNNDGIWNDTGARLKVIIVPPWWENTWFRLGILLLALTGVLVYFRLRTYQLKRSKRELEKRVALSTADLKQANAIIAERQKEIVQQNETLIQKNVELESQTTEIRNMAEEIRELTEARITFFANISQELHTPLNRIITQAEDLLATRSQSPEQFHDKHAAIYQNATRLIRLINQLLDMSRAETGALQLHPQKLDIVPVIRDTVGAYQGWAERRNVSLQVHCKFESLFVFVDEDKFEKILSNLLSNAMKSVHDHGNIEVEVLIAEGDLGSDLTIEVRDDGRGLTPEKLEELTKLFKNGRASKFPGSGLGLPLVKELLDLHKGSIQVFSVERAGAAFRFSIPVHLPEEMAAEVSSTRQTEAVLGRLHEEIEDLRDNRLQLPTILIIDNETEGGQFKYKRLRSTYSLEMAMSASEGLHMATEHSPDLILCDATLPDMPGDELCAALKADERTSHIPILMMVTRTTNEEWDQRVADLADDHILKPFQPDLLELKIKNIFFTRQTLKEMFLKGSLSDGAPVLSALDEEFLRKAVVVVRENMLNSEFSVDEFSMQFGMSRRNVLRKIRAITGLSINEFIRNTRLKEAYNLLLQGELNVSEVAYTVGFTDPKYFSNCFKKLFGKPPSEVRAVATPL